MPCVTYFYYIITNYEFWQVRMFSGIFFWPLEIVAKNIYSLNSFQYDKMSLSNNNIAGKENAFIHYKRLHSLEFI